MNKILKQVWDEFIYGGHFHSIGVTLLVFSISIVNNNPLDLYLSIIIYLGIQSAYLYNRYKDYEYDKTTNKNRTNQVENYLKYIPTITALSCIVVIAMFFIKRLYACLEFSVVLLLLGFLYSNYVKNYTSKILGLKNYFISLSFCSLVLLYSIYNHTWNYAVLILTVFLFIRVLGNTIFFDIKDLASDKKLGLLTFPVALGKDKALMLIKLLNYLSVIILLVGYFLNLLPLFSLFLVGVLPFSFYYIHLINRGYSADKVSYIYADGEYWVWAILLFIGKATLWN